MGGANREKESLARFMTYMQEALTNIDLEYSKAQSCKNSQMKNHVKLMKIEVELEYKIAAITMITIPRVT